MTLPRLVLGVPGPWQNLPEVARTIAMSGCGYEIEGNRYHSPQSKHSFEIELYIHDPGLLRSFEVAGEGRFTQAELAQIEGHQTTAYLIGEGGSAENAWGAAKAAVGLLDSGGIAVKIESTGKAHTARSWRESAASTDLFRLYRTFVVLVGARDHFYSCGMHNLGLPDAFVSSEMGPQVGANLLNKFNFYQVSKRPVLNSGHTFQLGVNEPVYQVKLEACTQFAARHPFHNPYGVWHIQPHR